MFSVQLLTRESNKEDYFQQILIQVLEGLSSVIPDLADKAAENPPPPIVYHEFPITKVMLKMT